MSLKKRYKQYAIGGGMDPLSMIGMGQQAAMGLIDAIAPTDEFGNQGALASALKGNAQFGTIGGILGYIKGREAKRQAGWDRNAINMQERYNQYRRGDAAISADPALVTGHKGAELYASGGFLKKGYYDTVKASGGSLNTLSKNSAEVVGPSHAAGGVDLPQYNSEVEGGETIQGDYVFSKQLGFAQQHRKLAKSIGKIEKKPATPERIRSLKNLHAGIEALKQQQEAIRQSI